MRHRSLVIEREQAPAFSFTPAFIFSLGLHFRVWLYKDVFRVIGTYKYTSGYVGHVGIDREHQVLGVSG